MGGYGVGHKFISRDVVKIRVLKTGKKCWYYDQIGKVVNAIREVTEDDSGTQWAEYKQYPAPTGYESSGHYVSYEIEEVETFSHTKLPQSGKEKK